MAIEKVIEIKVKGSAAQKDLDQLNATLEEQRSILIELERELLTIQELREKTSKTNLAAQKKLADQENHLKAAIKDQRLSLRELNAERRISTTESKLLNDQQLESSKIIQGLDKITGGYATKVKKLYEGFVESAKGVKLFIQGLSGVQKAILATGIGALVVALGLVVAYWDDIKGAISGVSSETSKNLEKQNKLTEATKAQYEASKAQDNILKLQGMSEEQILAYKKQQNAEYIKQLEAELLITQQVNSQKSARAAMLAMSTKGLSNLLGFGFDGEAAKAEIKSFQDAIATLKNESAGYQLSEEQLAKKAEESRRNNALKRIQEGEQLRADLLETERESEQISNDIFLQASQSFFAKKAEQDEINFGLYRDMQDEMFDLEYQAQIDNNNRKIDEDLAYNEAVAAIRMANLDNLGSAFSLLGQLAGKNRTLQAVALIGENAAGIAKTIIQTQASNAATIAQGNALSFITGGASVGIAAKLVAANKISAGLSIASSIAATAKGLSALKASGAPSVSAPNVSGGGNAASSPTPPAFNVVGQSNVNQLADVVSSQLSKPMRAYVVTSDVSTAQSLERNIVKGASL